MREAIRRRIAVVLVLAPGVPALRAEDQADAVRIKFETESLKDGDVAALEKALSALPQVGAAQVDHEDNEFVLELRAAGRTRALDLATIAETLQGVSSEVGNEKLRLRVGKTVLRGTILLQFEGVANEETNEALLHEIDELDDLSAKPITRAERATGTQAAGAEGVVVLGAFEVAVREDRSIQLEKVLGEVRDVDDDIRLTNVAFGASSSLKK